MFVIKTYGHSRYVAFGKIKQLLRYAVLYKQEEKEDSLQLELHCVRRRLAKNVLPF